MILSEVVQLVERHTLDVDVGGSNPPLGAMIYLSNPVKGPVREETYIRTWFINVHYLDDYQLNLFMRNANYADVTPF